MLVVSIIEYISVIDAGNIGVFGLYHFLTFTISPCQQIARSFLHSIHRIRIYCISLLAKHAKRGRTISISAQKCVGPRVM